MPWELGVGLFLLGGATGGWWSRRRAVARAVASAVAVATAKSEAAAQATAGHVFIGGGFEHSAVQLLDVDNQHYVDYVNHIDNDSPVRPISERVRGWDAPRLTADDGRRLGNSGASVVRRQDGELN